MTSDTEKVKEMNDAFWRGNRYMIMKILEMEQEAKGAISPESFLYAFVYTAESCKRNLKGRNEDLWKRIIKRAEDDAREITKRVSGSDIAR